MKHMITILITILRVNATINANRLIYALKNIPWIKKIIPDSIYGKATIKIVVAIIAEIKRAIGKIIGTLLYVLVMLIIPIRFFLHGNLLSQSSDAYIQLFLFLSLIAGSVQNTLILQADEYKYICIHKLHFQPRDFVISTLFANHIGKLIYFIPASVVACSITDANILQIFLLLLLMIALRFVSDAVQLYLYYKRILLKRKANLLFIISIASLAAAYLPLYFHLIWPIGNVLFSLPLVLLIFILGALGIRYILRFSGYKDVIHRSLKLDDLMPNIEKLQAQAMFESVKLDERKFSKEQLRSGLFKKNIGYKYLNAIFFSRHRSLLEKPILRRIGGIAVITTACILVTINFPKIASSLDNNILSKTPLFVFVMYIISLGDRICKAMFYNCDISLLRYSFYRNKAVVLQNFIVRLRKIIVLNSIVSLAICFAYFVYITASAISYRWTDLMLFMAAILCLGVFFSVHHLFLYYVFQPYTTELALKNPFFVTISAVVYFISYMCLQIRTDGGYFTIIVIAATITYTVIALILVYRLAPKNFRVK